MGKLIAGLLFLLMSVIVFSMKYIVVAIILSKSNSINRDLFSETLGVLPITVNIIAYSTFILGVISLLWYFKKRN